HINVLDEYTLDLNLKAKGPFTELFIGGITIIPGHIWSACGASTWNNGVTGKNIAGTSIVNAAEDTCVGHFGAPSITSVGGVRADSPTFDPMANNFLIGSGPYTCESTGGTGHPPAGTIGGGCSIDNTQYPPFGLNDFTLTRTGCTLTSTGTTCGIAGSSSDYFRSSGALANYIWSGDIGSGSADFSKVLTVNSCHSSTPSANCPHWAQGIGNPSLTSTSNPVGLSQRLKVNSLKGVSWIAFSTEKTTGTQLILSCIEGYTLPGTTLTPCNSPISQPRHEQVSRNDDQLASNWGLEGDPVGICMGQKNKKENSFDTLLNRSLEKQGHGKPPRYAQKPAARIWPRRHVRLTLSLTILLMVGLSASVWAWQNGLWFASAGPSGLRAVLIDGLSVSYPDPSFTNNVTKTLSSVGYTVDYNGPDKFTVDTLANL